MSVWMGRALALVLLWAAPAWAQAENGLKLGDARVHPTFDLEGDYDSEAGFFAQGTGANATATLSPEIIAHFRPGVRLELPASFVNLNVGGDVDWVQYTGLLSPGSQNASHLEAAANLEADFNKAGAIEFDVGDNFSRLDRTTDPIIGVGVLSLYNQAHAALPIHPGGGALTITPSVALSLEQYSPLSTLTLCTDPSCSPADLQNFDYVDGHGELAGQWKFLPKTAVVADVALDYQFYNETSAGATPFQNSELLHAEVGLVGLLTSKIAITAKAGWAQDFLDSGGHTVIGHAEINYLMSDTSNIKVGYLRDLLPVPEYGTYTDDRPYAELRFFLGGRLTLRAYAAYDFLNYNSNSGRVDQLVTVDLGPQYQFTRWLMGALGYTLQYRETNATAAQSVNYTRNVGYVRLTLMY
jgi:hypothetical protein